MKIEDEFRDETAFSVEDCPNIKCSMYLNFVLFNILAIILFELLAIK